MKSFYVKLREFLPTISKASTVKRRLSSLKFFFPETVLNQSIHFARLILKSTFNFLGGNMKCQKYSESEALLEIRNVLRYLRDQIAHLKMD